MKRILIALAIMLSVQMADAQVKSPADAKKAVEAAEVAAENPKKATKPATWIKLASAYMDAYSSPMGNGWVGAGKQELGFVMGSVKPISVENVTLSGESYSKEVYSTMNYYFNAAGVLSLIEVTKPVCENALSKALESYLKAAEVDVKKTKTKDIDEGIAKVGEKYLESGMNSYMLGDFKKASECFGNAAEAAASKSVPAVDSMAIYNAGFTAWMVGDNERAEQFFKKCVEIKYYEEGEVFAKLADIYTKMENKEATKDILEKGFEAYPQSQSIIIGLINYYIENNEDPQKLFALLDKAKANEPNNASLYYVEGDIHNKLGNKEDAIKAYMKSYEINPEYEFGLIGIGILYYNEAIEIQDKAQQEFDDAKYAALVEEFEQALLNAVEPFEKAFEVTKDKQIKVSIAEYLKNIYFRFRDKDAKYEEGYNKYNTIVANGEV